MAAEMSRKRTKTSPSAPEAEGETEEKSAPELDPREPNRLQKAKSGKRKDADAERKVTIAQAKRIKKAEKQLGILSALLDAPVEVFCETASYFTPEDLLNLSQVSRELREFLLSKNSRRLWTTCLSNTDLPSCPDDLNEPQYVFLLFDTSCNGCNAPRIRTVYYELRIRLCKTCFELNMYSGHQLLCKYPMARTEVLDLIPRFSRYGSSRKYYYEPDFEEVDKELNTIKDDDERQDYRIKRRKIMAKINRNAYDLRERERLEIIRRKEELHDLRTDYVKSVKEKLKEFGYTENDWSRWYIGFDEINLKEEWDKLVVYKKALTPRIWKTLLPKLQHVLDSNRLLLDATDKNRREVERDAEFRKIYCNFSRDLIITSGEVELMPCVPDLMKFSAIADVIKQDRCRRVFTEDLFEALLPTIKTVHQEHRLRILRDHEKAIQEYRVRGEQEIYSADVSGLAFLASSFYASYGVSAYYFINPEVPVVVGLPNRHFHKAVSCECNGWHKQYASIHKDYIVLADALLADLDLSPTTTMNSMIAMGKCFVCGLCDETFRNPLGWVELIEHYISRKNWQSNAQRQASWHYRSDIVLLDDHPTENGNSATPVVSARRLEGQELIFAKERQEANAKLKSKRCTLCKWLMVDYEFMTGKQVVAHIRTIHGKEADPNDIIDLSEDT